jgi:hypothetical protein
MGNADDRLAPDSSGAHVQDRDGPIARDEVDVRALLRDHSRGPIAPDADDQSVENIDGRAFPDDHSRDQQRRLLLIAALMAVLAMAVSLLALSEHARG